ncbi:hypothetical protein U2W12_10705 [Methylomicrobium sp. Wu6]|nr:hypothetical protein [Methylomicrobium sp. Wu6]
MQNVTESYLDQFQMGEKAIEFGCGQSIEKLVLVRAMRVSHMNHSYVSVEVEWPPYTAKRISTDKRNGISDVFFNTMRYE